MTSLAPDATWQVLIVLTLAVWRVTRAVVTDTVGAPLRGWLERRGAKREVMRNQFSGEVLAERIVRRDGRPISWVAYQVVTCPWCASAWIAGAAILLEYYQGAWFIYVAEALAVAAVAGLLSERT